MQEITSRKEFCEKARSVVWQTIIYDIHTHVYSEPFGELVLWGLDNLLTYHYLVAEFFRYSSMSYEDFWALEKTEQARLIWKTLFVERSPVSEACRGVLTVLKELGLSVSGRDLGSLRGFFKRKNIGQYIDLVWEKTNLEKVVMTNDPFDDRERVVWEKGGSTDSRFEAVLPPFSHTTRSRSSNGRKAEALTRGLRHVFVLICS